MHLIELRSDVLRCSTKFTPFVVVVGVVVCFCIFLPLIN